MIILHIQNQAAHIVTSTGYTDDGNKNGLVSNKPTASSSYYAFKNISVVPIRTKRAKIEFPLVGYSDNL